MVLMRTTQHTLDIYKTMSSLDDSSNRHPAQCNFAIIPTNIHPITVHERSADGSGETSIRVLPITIPKTIVLLQYHGMGAIWLAAIQLVLGVICIVVNSVALSNNFLVGFAHVCHGYWVGVWVVCCGVLGFYAGKHRTYNLVAANMAMCIVGAAAAGCGMALSIAGLDQSYDNKNIYSSRALNGVLVGTLFVVTMFLIGIVCIVAAVLCCYSQVCCAPATVCRMCDCPGFQPQEETAFILYNNPSQVHPALADDPLSSDHPFIEELSSHQDNASNTDGMMNANTSLKIVDTHA